jgi:hypothetical protein
MAMTPKEMIEVLRHFVDGGEVECREHDTEIWARIPSPTWSFDEYDYRIKPKPLELWVNVYPEPRSSTSCSCFRTEGEAIRFRGNHARTIHMREVLGD